MANIRIKDLPADSAPKADDKVPIDLGTTRNTTVEEFVFAGRPTATKTEAEAGTDNKKAMTPLAVKQAIDAQTGMRYVPVTRRVDSGAGLSGGQELTGDVTLSLSATSIASLAKADSAVQSVNGKSGNAVTLVKADIGLGNADNTSDINKPISTATQGALDGKYDNPAGTTAQYIRGDGSLSAFPAIPQGTVTSVGLTVPTGLSAFGSPVTTSGTIAISYAAGYQGYTSAEASKLSGIAAGAQVNTVNSVNTKTGAVVLNASDVGAVSDTFVPDINANTAARHTHSNKAILDATTASFLAAEKTKLAGIAAGATANTGTVTSVSVTVPTGLSVAGTPITTNGTLAITYASGYEGFTTAQKNKLAGIPADADKTPSLATVATSGNYSDLNGRPTLGALAAKDKVGIADLSATGTPNASTFLRGDNTWGTVAGAGTVTSVAMTVPTGLSVSGSPITGSGILAVSYASGYQGYTTAEANKLSGIAAGAQVNTVTSVNTKTGAVVLSAGDVGALPSTGGTVTGNIDATGYIQADGDIVTQANLWVGATNVITAINEKAGFYSGSNVDEVNFPIGATIICYIPTPLPPRNAILSPRLRGEQDLYSAVGTGSLLSGVWRSSGHGDGQQYLCRRVS